MGVFVGPIESRGCLRDPIGPSGWFDESYNGGERGDGSDRSDEGDGVDGVDRRKRKRRRRRRRGRRRNCCGWTDGTGIESSKRGPKNILSWFLLVCPCIFFIFRISKAIWGVFSDTSNPHSTQGMLFFSTPSEDMCLTRGKCIPKNRPNIPLRYQSQTGNIR